MGSSCEKLWRKALLIFEDALKVRQIN